MSACLLPRRPRVTATRAARFQHVSTTWEGSRAWPIQSAYFFLFLFHLNAPRRLPPFGIAASDVIADDNGCRRSRNVLLTFPVRYWKVPALSRQLWLPVVSPILLVLVYSSAVSASRDTGANPRHGLSRRVGYLRKDVCPYAGYV